MSLLLALTTGEGTVYTSVADPGVFVFAGSNTTDIIQSQSIAGAYNLSGSNTVDGIQSSAQPGSMLITGSASADITQVIALSGTYSITGADSVDAIQTASEAGVYNFVGIDTTDTVVSGSIVHTSIADPAACAYSGVDTTDEIITPPPSVTKSGWWRLMLEEIQARSMAEDRQRREAREKSPVVAINSQKIPKQKRPVRAKTAETADTVVPVPLKPSVVQDEYDSYGLWSFVHGTQNLYNSVRTERIEQEKLKNLQMEEEALIVLLLAA